MTSSSIALITFPTISSSYSYYIKMEARDKDIITIIIADLQLCFIDNTAPF